MSKSHTGIKGYHWENQSNFSSFTSVSSFDSGGSILSVSTTDADEDNLVKSLDDFDNFGVFLLVVIGVK